MGSKNDSYYIEKVLNEINIIIDYTKGLSYEELLKDQMTLDAAMFRMQQMVEQIENLSQGFKDTYNEFPWNNIIGFRNRIVHEYGKTDYTTVYETISNDIYRLKGLFESLL